MTIDLGPEQEPTPNKNGKINALELFNQHCRKADQNREEKALDDLPEAEMMTPDIVQQEREPTEYLAGTYFPVGYTTAMVAAGGTGKTLFLTQLAVSHPETGFLIVSGEDKTGEYAKKVKNILYTGQHGELLDRPSGDASHIGVDFCGDTEVPLMLQDANTGNWYPGPLLARIRKRIEQNPNFRVIFIETVSQFLFDEDNAAFRHAVRACNNLATDTNTAIVLVHHTGKQVRDGFKDIYAGRGGSTLGDNTRSFILLTALKSRQCSGWTVDVDQLALDDGYAIEVLHVRNSYGPREQTRFYRINKGACNGVVLGRLNAQRTNEMPAEPAYTPKQQEQSKRDIILRRIDQADGSMPIRKLYDDWRVKDHGLSQKAARKLIQDMLEDGTLVKLAGCFVRGSTETLMRQNGEID